MYCRPFRLLKLFVAVLTVLIIFYEFSRLLISSDQSSSSSSLSDSFPSRSSLLLGDEISTDLDPFYIALPHFSDDEARNWFYSSSYYKFQSRRCPNGVCEEKGVLFNDSKEHLSIRTTLVKNGLYLNDDCGYNYPPEAVRRQFSSAEQTTVIYDEAILYPVPDGWSFQHFLDGIGPKLAHSRALLTKYPRAKVIILQGVRFDRSVKEIWAMLGQSLSLFLFMIFSLSLSLLSRCGRVRSFDSLFFEYSSGCSSVDQSVSNSWDSSSAVARGSSDVLADLWSSQSSSESVAKELHLHSTHVEQCDEWSSSDCQ